MTNRKITWETSLSGVKMCLIDSLTRVITFYVHLAVSVRSETQGWIKNRKRYGMIFHFLARILRDLDELSI